MKKILNRNHIKLIALVTMLIDHICLILQPTLPYWAYLLLRTIGRISFPLFAYFVSEGFYYTKSKGKYALKLFIFGLISQMPFYLVTKPNYIYLNIMFTFLISILFMWLFDKLFRENNGINKSLYVTISILLLFLIEMLSAIKITTDYSSYGILITLMFYIFKNQKIKSLVWFAVLVITNLSLGLLYSKTIEYELFFVAFQLLAIPLLLIYNGKKGSINFKYVFYWFYPLHLIMLYIIKIIIY